MSEPSERESKYELAEQVGMNGQPGSRLHAQLEAKLLAQCTGDLEAALNALRASQEAAANASSAVAAKIFWLNIVLTAATALGALAALVQAWRTYFS